MCFVWSKYDREKAKSLAVKNIFVLIVKVHIFWYAKIFVLDWDRRNKKKNIVEFVAYYDFNVQVCVNIFSIIDILRLIWILFCMYWLSHHNLYCIGLKFDLFLPS